MSKFVVICFIGWPTSTNVMSLSGWFLEIFHMQVLVQRGRNSQWDIFLVYLTIQVKDFFLFKLGWKTVTREKVLKAKFFSFNQIKQRFNGNFQLSQYELWSEVTLQWLFFKYVSGNTLMFSSNQCIRDSNPFASLLILKQKNY